MSIKKFKDVTYDLSTTEGYLCNTITTITATTGEAVSAIEVFNNIIVNPSEPARPLTATNMNATIDDISSELAAKIDEVGNGTTKAVTANGKSISYAEIACLDGVRSAIQQQLDAMVLRVYPIGAIYMSANATNPQTLFGGSWVVWGSGRVPVGIDTTQTEFKTVEKTGGEKAHQLIDSEMPSHRHAKGIEGYNNTNDPPRYIYGSTINTSQTTQLYVTGYNYRAAVQYEGLESCGRDVAHNNLQPYITCYMWKRIG